eukprot:m.81514 g.81514  ORF g.81514 m.81514 type:complete len:389 (-) comp12638_c0_seq2:399-1565(-)
MKLRYILFAVGLVLALNGLVHGRKNKKVRGQSCKNAVSFAAKALGVRRKFVECDYTVASANARRPLRCQVKGSGANPLKIACNTRGKWKTLYSETEFFLPGATNLACNSVELSPDGKYFAAGCRDGLYIVGARSGVVKQFVAFSNTVRSVAWSPDGTTLIAGDYNRVISLVNAATGIVINSLTSTQQISGVDFEPRTGQYLVAGIGSSDTVTLYDTSFNEIWSINFGEYIEKVRFSHSGKKLCVPDLSSSVHVIDVESGTIDWTASLGDYGFDCKWSHNDVYLVVGDEDYTVSKFNAKTGNLIWAQTNIPSDYVYAVGISPNGNLVASGDDDGNVLLLDGTTGKILHAFPVRGDYVQDIHFTPDGLSVYGADFDGYVFFYDIPDKFIY